MIEEKLLKMFKDMREELIKGKGNAPTPKGEVKGKRKGVSKDKEQDNSELTDEQRKAIKAKSKDTKETESIILKPALTTLR